jgi:tRNA-dihydrouridine synthase
MNFWNELKTKDSNNGNNRSDGHIIGQSPLDGLTDYPFRKMLSKYGKPDVTYTEFVCVDQIFHAKKDVIDEFIYDEDQRPVVAQIFGIDPELFYISAQIACELGFDGVDINMGCPSKNVASRGAGAGLIKNPELTAQIISATKKGIEDWIKDGFSKDFPTKVQDKMEATKKELIKKSVKINNNRESIPVSLKTRIGYSQNEIETWLPFLVKQNVSCIALHGRTYKQMYTGKADWQAIARAKQIIDLECEKNPELTKPVFLGNGDIQSLEQAHEYCDKYKIDGVLIGRAFLGRPWLLTPGLPQLEITARQPKPEDISKQETTITDGLALEKIFAIILEHSKLQEEFDSKNFYRVRKHLAWYCKGFKGASELRRELVLTSSFAEVQNILKIFLTK